MSDIVIKPITDIEPYSGPHAIPGIRFRAAREALGVTAWGMNVLELDAGCSAYPEHDHQKDGQEEVYIVLDGAAVLHVDDVQRPIEAGDMVRVGPSHRRKFVTHDQGVTLLAIGGTPGQAYPAGTGG
ncbi:MAG: cupin domain-containing protein [Myxococcales bacterium]|nr:cupin domain-containing protein [Myxococcales bacterium]